MPSLHKEEILVSNLINRLWKINYIWNETHQTFLFHQNFRLTDNESYQLQFLCGSPSTEWTIMMIIKYSTQINLALGH